jgi:hypothetical protein
MMQITPMCTFTMNWFVQKQRARHACPISADHLSSIHQVDKWRGQPLRDLMERVFQIVLQNLSQVWRGPKYAPLKAGSERLAPIYSDEKSIDTKQIAALSTSWIVLLQRWRGLGTHGRFNPMTVSGGLPERCAVSRETFG